MLFRVLPNKAFCPPAQHRFRTMMPQNESTGCHTLGHAQPTQHPLGSHWIVPEASLASAPNGLQQHRILGRKSAANPLCFQLPSLGFQQPETHVIDFGIRMVGWYGKWNRINIDLSSMDTSRGFCLKGYEFPPSRMTRRTFLHDSFVMMANRCHVR